MRFEGICKHAEKLPSDTKPRRFFQTSDRKLKGRKSKVRCLCESENSQVRKNRTAILTAI